MYYDTLKDAKVWPNDEMWTCNECKNVSEQHYKKKKKIRKKERNLSYFVKADNNTHH